MNNCFDIAPIKRLADVPRLLFNDARSLVNSVSSSDLRAPYSKKTRMWTIDFALEVSDSSASKHVHLTWGTHTGLVQRYSARVLTLAR
jgi:hypothetical protein